MGRVPYDCDDIEVGRELGSCRDFTPSYDLPSRKKYKRHVRRCADLVGDEASFHAAGCKRVGHVQITGGRSSFGGQDPYAGEFLSAATRQRLEFDRPNLDARTQSPLLRRKGESKMDTKESALAAQVEEALLSYAAVSGQATALTILIPRSPNTLVSAGMPPEAAKVLVQYLGGQAVDRTPVFGKLRARLEDLLGDAQLVFAQSNAYLSLEQTDLRKLRGSMRPLSPLFGYYKQRALKVGKKGYPRERIYGLLPIVDIRSGDVSLLTRPGEAAFLAALDKASDRPGEMVVTLGQKPGGPKGSWPLPHPTVKIKLQHSVWASPLGRGQATDYTTLRGLNLSELPAVVARKVVSPRKKRRGRQRSLYQEPTSTRKNPMARKNPRYKNASLSSNQDLNKASDYYFPGTAWDWYQAGHFGVDTASVPVNRRNPSKKKSKKALTSKQISAGFGGRDAMLKNNPKRRPYWPRHSEYEQALGPYGPVGSTPSAPNRRNPKSKGTMIGRFPSPCKKCGESMKGHEIHQVGVGPRGGKQMAHVNCGY